MPLPRLFATALWLLVTVASTAMVWTATSIVAGDVTDRPASVLAHRDVVSELQSASSAPAATPTSAPPRSSTTSTAPPPNRDRPPAPAPAPAGDPGPAAPPEPAPPPVPTVAPPAAPATTAPGSPPTTGAPATPQPPDRQTATYSTAGGVVRVVCDGRLIELVSAIPTNGYKVDVVAAGPANVEVHFVRGGRDLPVRAVCFNRPIRY